MPKGELISVSGLPRLSHCNAPVLLLAGGKSVAVGDRGHVTIHDLQSSEAGVTASEVARHPVMGHVVGLAVLASGALVVAAHDEGRTHLQICDRKACRELTSIAGQLTALEVAARVVVAALSGTRDRAPSLIGIDAASGTVVLTRPLASAAVALTAAPDGNSVTISDRTATVTRVPLGANGPGKARPTQEPEDSAGRYCCKCGKDAMPGKPPKRPPDDDKRPGTHWLPGGCDEWIAAGAVVTHNRRCTDDPPCKQRLDFSVAKLWLAGKYLVAASVNAQNIVLMDAQSLRLQHARAFGRQGATVTSVRDAEMLLVYRWASRKWGILDFAHVQDGLLPWDKIAPKPAESITFYGHNPDNLPSLPAPQIGLKRVIALPIIEPGQTFGDPNVNNFGAFMRTNSFDVVNRYYDETSFDQLDMQIELFGLDAGPAGPPLTMPAAFRSYFWPPFKAGGVKASVVAPATPYSVLLDGTEQLSIHAVPRVRAAEDLVIPFCALGCTEAYAAFPVTLDFDGSETAELEIVDSEGTTWNLTLNFPAESIDIEQANVDTGLAALRSYLDNVLDDAESNAGVPGGSPLFASVEVRRVKLEGSAFGNLDLNFRMNAGPGPDKGRVSIVSQTNLAKLGFDDPVNGAFRFPGFFASLRLDTYFERALKQAEADAGYDYTNRLLGDSSVQFDTPTSTLTVEFALSPADGGDGASINVTANAGLSGLGFNAAVSVPGESNRNDANALKDSQKFIDDLFTAAIDRLGGMPDPVSFFDPYIVVLAAFVGQAPGGEWNASQPDVTGLRMFTRNATAEHNANPTVQLQRRFIGTVLDGTPDNAAMAHELGHALGLPDAYPQAEHRDDLLYMEGWEMMDDHPGFPHFCAYYKYALGWIEPARLTPVPLPVAAGPTVTEALLVPVERWDAGMEAAVQAEFGNGLPVAQAMSINLGGDGVQFDMVEARQAGVEFSHHLPTQPALLVYNVIDINDDTRYVLDHRYRRKLHRLNTGNDLTATGDEFDLAAAPELSAVGVKVSILDVRNVTRPSGDVTVFHARVHREQADFVDLAFTEATPNWKCVDVWVDWAGDNPSDDPDDHHVYPEGTPSDQGEAVHYPASDTELHWVVARIHNRGTANAMNVKINAFRWDPPGAGDTGNKVLFRSGTIDVVPADGFVTIPLSWEVTPIEHAHQCLRCEIADWELPEDPADAIALASDDVWLTNNWGQKNVFDFIALGGSPYAPIEFEYSVTNDGVFHEKAYLEPEGLPVGMKLTVTPRVRLIDPHTTAIFRCVLELDGKVIDTGCKNDREFLLAAWRETRLSYERWGACKYKVRPRKKTAIKLGGSWIEYISIQGAVTPDPGPGRVLLRIAFRGQPRRWTPVTLQPGGLFAAQIKPEARTHLEVVAHYEGSVDFAPAYSDILHLDPPKPIA